MLIALLLIYLFKKVVLLWETMFVFLKGFIKEKATFRDNNTMCVDTQIKTSQRLFGGIKTVHFNAEIHFRGTLAATKYGVKFCLIAFQSDNIIKRKNGL